jgi:beta-lactam-binding protein with PASTA domain
MAGLASLLPRFVALPLVALLGTATLTFAANSQLTSPSTPAEPAAVALPTVLVVPDVRRQAFVFAKGTLEDAGFSWKVNGSVEGFAANIVASQSPQPGTRVVDTGSPTIQVTLSPNGQYKQEGSPENAAPYPGSAVKVAGAETAVVTPTPAAPAVKPKPAAKPKATASKRPPAFAVPGGKAEPLDEMPLPDRVKALGRYVASHPADAASVNHFLYQHAWIVTGAEFGWWRGAEALELLVAVDRQAQQRWGYGARSESLARAALARVKAKSAR